MKKLKPEVLSFLEKILKKQYFNSVVENIETHGAGTYTFTEELRQQLILQPEDFEDDFCPFEWHTLDRSMMKHLKNCIEPGMYYLLKCPPMDYFLCGTNTYEISRMLEIFGDGRLKVRLLRPEDFDRAFGRE